jgi:hypothetical protein
MADSTPTKAELAAARRAKKRAEQEAAALHANLHRRKAQSRAREAAINPPCAKPGAGADKCP